MQSNGCRLIAALVLLLIQRPLLAGITCKLRIERPAGAFLMTIWAEGMSFRSQIEPSDNLSEFERQYPITISTDGGRVQRHLRPENKTWYEDSSDKPRGSIAIGANPRVLQPSVSMIEEPSNDVIDGQPIRRYVLKTSYVIESDIDTEKIRLHKTSTVLLSVAAVSCAPSVAAQFGYKHFAIKDIDDAVAQKLSAIHGLILRETTSSTDRYDGGMPRTMQTKTEVIDSKCIELDPSLLQIPKGYEHQEPVIGAP